MDAFGRYGGTRHWLESLEIGFQGHVYNTPPYIPRASPGAFWVSYITVFADVPG